MSQTVKAEVRESAGKNAARRLRSQGNVPAILYGPKIKNVPLVLSKQDIFSILKSERGINTIFKITFDSKKKNVMIKDFQLDVVSDELLHVDLIEIAMSEAIEVTVQVELTGEAVGVKSEGGFVDFTNREVEVRCLPKNIPDQISIDISDLHLHESVKVGDIEPPEDVEFITEPDTVIAHIMLPEEEEIEEEEELEEELIVEGEEPEVIGEEGEEEVEEEGKEEGKETEKKKEEEDKKG
ncbi:MAG: 50S ribosomal protein L25 [Candidatus Aminicenantes bacterium]|nr:50S ribosomal protein L25 [Candidatus Aminicenantes bacterium]